MLNYSFDLISFLSTCIRADQVQRHVCFHKLRGLLIMDDRLLLPKFVQLVEGFLRRMKLCPLNQLSELLCGLICNKKPECLQEKLTLDSPDSWGKVVPGPGMVEP